jgi:hypothetical protein
MPVVMRTVTVRMCSALCTQASKDASGASMDASNGPERRKSSEAAPAFYALSFFNSAVSLGTTSSTSPTKP